MNIFAILYCYPPLLVPATMCYVKLLLGLRECGYNIDVLTIEPDSFDAPGEHLIDSSLAQLIPDGVVDHKIWSWETRPLVRFLKKFEISKGLFYKLFEPRKREWTFPAINYLKKRNLNKYDLILSCSQPHCNHLIGYYLKRKTDKPWIAYFSDPWTDSPYANYPSEKVYTYNLQLERTVVGHADKVLFTSEEMLRLVTKKYPGKTAEKCGVLPHSFVPDWYILAGKEKLSTRNNRKIRMVQTGHFYGPRTPMPLLNMLNRLNQQDKISERIEILFYGNMDVRYINFIKEHRMDGFIKLMGTIPYLESLSVMKDADYLLLIDAPLKRESESVFLPSKLIDYAGSGRPVIGITPGRGTSAKVLKDIRNINCDIEDERRIYDIFMTIIEGSLNIETDETKVALYHYKHVANKLNGIIQGLA